ncbi:Leucine carboxyl methyltransferase [Macleaya cordata]|uniref:Leucine carboxyl methyltransferase n=1 Tax=Macleaya cordata TaxID=56857 RepID=A0A200QQF5_MACCD|nr:Leucine carboxyl methyltransferase [Macleaya cordata]
MGCFAPAAAAALPCPPNIRTSRRRKKINGGVSAKLNDLNDPLFEAAINGASLRFQETHRPEPLFLDPYAGCFITPDVQKDLDQCSFSRSSSCHYCLATKFIDDKLLSTMNKMDGLRQVVLFTDGMDTRPYRLKWPNSTVIFDLSPHRIFQGATQKLKDVGAKIPRSCLLVHVPSDSFDIQEILYRKGFNGNRPSIWALQGLPLMTLENFKDIMVLVSSLATKGCIFFGELPAWLVETEVAMKGLQQPDMQNWMDKFFMSNGFRVEVIAYDEVARKVGRDPPSGDCRNIPFVAEQLRLSDDQMESWRREFQRVEEEGDEEGFEEI